MREIRGSSPPHMQFDRAWELANGPDPELLHEYFLWLNDDVSRLQSATEGMQWLPPGFNTFLIARDANPDGTTRQSLQLNLYHEDYPGNEEPHGHSRNARASWYALPDTSQIISRYRVLGPNASRVDGLDIEMFKVAGNCIVDLQNGQRPLYEPVVLGDRLMLKESEIMVAPLGTQKFSSVEVHHVGFQGRGVAISAHYKGAEESPKLSEGRDLVAIKKVSREEAEELVRVRNNLVPKLASLATGDVQPRLGPITMMYLNPESPHSIEKKPTNTPGKVAEELITGALKTAEELAKAA